MLLLGLMKDLRVDLSYSFLQNQADLAELLELVVSVVREALEY